MKLEQSIVHIPHASTLIPDDDMPWFTCSKETLADELARLTDWYTDTIFDLSDFGVRSLQYPVSRLVCDPERFEDDALEPCSKIGMGVVYTKTTTGKTLRNTDSAGWSKYRHQLINSYYKNHHKKLNAMANDIMDRYGEVLIIDGHSYPNDPLPTELRPSSNRPNICIGTDPFHTPESLVKAAEGAFLNEGFTVGINIPFEGTMIPMDFYGKNSQAKGIMIEINRDIYLNEGNAKKNSFDRTVERIRRAIISSIHLA